MQQENTQQKTKPVELQKQRSIVLPIVITALVTLIIVGLVSYLIFSSIQNSEKQELTQKVEYLENKIEVLEKNDTQVKNSGVENQYSQINNWETFTFDVDNANFSFKYPIGWQVEGAGINDFLISYRNSKKNYSGRPFESFILTYILGNDVYDSIKNSGTEIEKINLQYGLDGYKYKGLNEDVCISFTKGDQIFTLSMLDNLSDDYFSMMQDILYSFKVLE